MNTKSWIVFIVATVVLLGGLVYLSRGDKVNVDNIDSNKIIKNESQDTAISDHVKGNADAKVVLIEYGDFECSACASAYSAVKAINKKYGKDIAISFRNYPLSQIHPNARAAAAAAESAGLQGKFWEMHDLLYENQKSWSPLRGEERTKIFESYAQTINLDIEKFRQGLTDPRVEEKIAKDIALARKANLSATPSFILDGELLDQSIKDGKIVDKDTKEAALIWQDLSTIGKLKIEPAIEKAKQK